MPIELATAKKALNLAVALGLVPSTTDPEAVKKMAEVLQLVQDEKRTSLHGNIMNIPHVAPDSIDTEPASRAYALGHRDARHSAAELALSS